MAETRVFVDDAVLGRLPDVCAKDGIPATGRLRVIEEVGRTNRLGVLWLLLFAGPVGWVVLAFLSGRDHGEQLRVELPFSDAAYERLLSARRTRNLGVAGAVLGGVGLLLLTGWAELEAMGLLLTLVAVAVGTGVAMMGEWRIGQASVRVSLDASRRWVTVAHVHPNFAAACAERSRDERRV